MLVEGEDAEFAGGFDRARQANQPAEIFRIGVFLIADARSAGIDPELRAL
jgi:hypothetical protein